MQGSLAKKHVDALINILQNISKTYEHNHSVVGEKDRETQDLLHEFEFAKLDSKRRNKLGKEMEKVRKVRRKASDENRTLKPLYDYFHGKSILRDLKRIQQDIVKEEQKMEVRAYTPRVRNDLTFTDKQAISSMKEAFEKAK